MELKLSVSIGATLQVKNAKGDWDWIKPEVGAEMLLAEGDDLHTTLLQERFTSLWDQVVGPQFASVVRELISDQTPKMTQEESLQELSDINQEIEKSISKDEWDEYD